MKGLSLPLNTLVIIVAFVIMLAAAIFYVISGNNSLLNINFNERALQATVEMQEKELAKLYDDYKNNDGGFDAYEISILMAQAIEYTWRDCNACKDEKELFTGFFATHPINFSKDMDCGNYHVGKSDYPNIAKIRGRCSAADIGADKTKKVDEWTVTAWGLSANTQMCGNYKLSSKEDSKQWGNNPCDGDNEITSGKKCADFCDRSGGVDKIVWKNGEIMKKGNKYSTVRIAYNPDVDYNPLTEEPKIIVKEIST